MQSRRDLLRTTAGGASVGLVAALAGCSDETSSDEDGANGGDEGDDTDDGTANGSDENGDGTAEAFDHTDWVYDPEPLNEDSMSIQLLDVQGYLGVDEISTADDVREDLEDRYNEGLDAEDVEYNVTINTAEILTGSFDETEITEAMELSVEDSYEGFELYTSEENSDLMIATDGDVLVRSSPELHHDFGAREEIEHLIDTAAGVADRYIDINEGYERVSMETEGKIMVIERAITDAVAEENDDRVDAYSHSFTVDGAETTIKIVELHSDEETIDLEEIESYFEETDDIELTDLAQDGRLLTIEYTGATADIM